MRSAAVRVKTWIFGTAGVQPAPAYLEAQLDRVPWSFRFP